MNNSKNPPKELTEDELRRYIRYHKSKSEKYVRMLHKLLNNDLSKGGIVRQNSGEVLVSGDSSDMKEMPIDMSMYKLKRTVPGNFELGHI